MADEEWIACRDPRKMLKRREYSAKISQRRMRLFLAGCGRLIWSRLPDIRNQQAVEVGEQFAEGLVGIPDLEQAFLQASPVSSGHPILTERYYAVTASLQNLTTFPVGFEHAIAMVEKSRKATPVAERAQLAEAQCGLIRDLFWSSFRPEFFEASWLVKAVVDLARDIEVTRDFTRMPTLGDALEAAGCRKGTILEHCRGRSDHFPGCWVIDGLLEKN